jgi:hypothetical protein
MGQPGVKAPITVFTSAARTSTSTSSVFTIAGGGTGTGADYRGVVLQVTASTTGTGASVTFALQKSTNGSTWTPLVTSAAVTAAGAVAPIMAHPSAAAVTNVATSGAMAGLWRCVATHANTTSIIYSVNAFPID